MLGQPNYRPHVGEFIRGTGVRVDGVVTQDVGGNGPFTFVLPDDVCLLTSVEVIGGGLGGIGGGTIGSPFSLGGGRGGNSGLLLRFTNVPVLPSSTLTVTVAASTAGSAAGVFFPQTTEATTVAGLLAGFSVGLSGTLSTGTLDQYSDDAGGSASAIATTGGGGTAAGGDGAANSDPDINLTLANSGYVFSKLAGAGGGGRAAGAAGGNGGGVNYFFSAIPTLQDSAAGTNPAGVSRGGGGQGGFSPYGRGGYGGSNSVGEGAPVGNYGAGGGGGAGGFAGGAGAPGYVRFTYWSAR
jgi:hypothetical protein